MGGEVANGHMTVGGKGEGEGRGRGRVGGARQWRVGRALHSGSTRLVILGPSGPPLWAHRAYHSGPIRPITPRAVRPTQYKARGLAAGLKKN